jgi:hypothetical protein
MFAELLCEDLQLEAFKFVKPISESIRSQVIDFEAIHEYELPNAENQRVEINVRHNDRLIAFILNNVYSSIFKLVKSTCEINLNGI